MKRTIIISLLALTAWSCNKTTTAKTTGHLYVLINWKHSSDPAYWKVDLLTEKGTSIKSLTTTNAQTKLDFGELDPCSYYLDGFGEDNNGVATYSTQKSTQVNITANNDQTITLTF